MKNILLVALVLAVSLVSSGEVRAEKNRILSFYCGKKFMTFPYSKGGALRSITVRKSDIKRVITHVGPKPVGTIMVRWDKGENITMVFTASLANDVIKCLN